MKRKFYINPNRISSDEAAIKLLDYNSETAHFYVIGKIPHRSVFHKHDLKWFDTWDDARACLLRLANDKAINCAGLTQRAFDDIVLIAALEKPRYRAVKPD